MTGVIRDRIHLALALGLIACVAGCSTPQAPATAPPDPAIAYLAQDFTCKRADATEVQLSALEKSPLAYDEKCVRLRVFTDAALLYDDAGHKGAKPLGVFWKNGDTARHLKLGPSFVVIIGRVRSCATRHTIAPASLCRGDASLFVSEAMIIPTAMD
jgi:hypothetical protein